MIFQAGDGGWPDPGEHRPVEQQAEGGADCPPGRHLHHQHYYLDHDHHFIYLDYNDNQTAHQAVISVILSIITIIDASSS